MIPSRNYPPRRPRVRENVNEAIRVREVRAVFPDGSVEIMPTLAAVRKAQEMGLDLILIAPTAEPPVAKAMDYGQWQYENKKKQHEAKKKQHVIQVKELKFRPNTDDHDYEFKKNHAIRFLRRRQPRESGSAIPRPRDRARRSGQEAAAAFCPGPVGTRNGRRPAAAGRPQRARNHQSGEGDDAPQGQAEGAGSGAPPRRISCKKSEFRMKQVSACYLFSGPLALRPHLNSGSRILNSSSRTNTSATDRRSSPAAASGDGWCAN